MSIGYESSINIGSHNGKRLKPHFKVLPFCNPDYFISLIDPHNRHSSRYTLAQGSPWLNCFALENDGAVG
jgi:hypothetical protein